MFSLPACPRPVPPMVFPSTAQYQQKLSHKPWTGRQTGSPVVLIFPLINIMIITPTGIDRYVAAVMVANIIHRVMVWDHNSSLIQLPRQHPATWPQADGAASQYQQANPYHRLSLGREISVNLHQLFPAEWRQLHEHYESQPLRGIIQPVTKSLMPYHHQPVPIGSISPRACCA